MWMYNLLKALLKVEGGVTISKGILTFADGATIDLASVVRKLPTAVIEMEGGLIQSVRSSEPMRVIILDEDIEGAEKEQLTIIDRNEVYLHHFLLNGSSGSSADQVDPEYVKNITSQIELDNLDSTECADQESATLTIDLKAVFDVAKANMDSDVDLRWPIGMALEELYGKQGIEALQRKMEESFKPE